MPNGLFKTYGDVLSLETRDESGLPTDKIRLYVQIAPTTNLVALTKAKQKIYTSCEAARASSCRRTLTSHRTPCRLHI
jgi:hypothetical protein